MSLKGVILSVKVLECFGKIFWKYLWKSWIFKKLYYTWTSSKVILRFSAGIFSLIYLSTYLQKPVCVLHSRHTLYSYSYLQKVLLTAFTIPEMESERKISLWITFLDYICHLIWSIYLILYHYKFATTQKKWSLSFA